MKEGPSRSAISCAARRRYCRRRWVSHITCWVISLLGTPTLRWPW